MSLLCYSWITVINIKVSHGGRRAVVSTVVWITVTFPWQSQCVWLYPAPTREWSAVSVATTMGRRRMTWPRQTVRSPTAATSLGGAGRGPWPQAARGLRWAAPWSPELLAFQKLSQTVGRWSFPGGLCLTTVSIAAILEKSDTIETYASA